MAVETELVETANGWPYSLYKTNAEGAFVGAIRPEIALDGSVPDE